MKLITKELREKLLANGKASSDGECDLRPVVKRFTPDGAATWLLVELDPKDPDLAFGLCDLGMGFPELGYVRISEIESVRGQLGLPVERDKFFTGDKPISAYAREASNLGHIKA